MQPVPELTLTQLKQQRDQACFTIGQRSVGIKVAEALQAKEIQGIYELDQKIQKMEQEESAKQAMMEAAKATTETIAPTNLMGDEQPETHEPEFKVV